MGRGRSYIWFLAGLLAIVAGFWPSFYGDPARNDVWHIAHGAAATLASGGGPLVAGDVAYAVGDVVRDLPAAGDAAGWNNSAS